MSRNNRTENWFSGLIGLFIISLALFIFSKVYEGTVPKIVEEVNNGAIGAILTAVITAMLLRKQSSSEEIKEQNAKIFEKKLEVYHDYLAKLQEVIQDEEITPEETKILMVQYCKIQMHADFENVKSVMEATGSILEIIGQNTGPEKSDNNKSTNVMIMNNLMLIVEAFRAELYKTDIDKDRIKNQHEKLSNLLAENINRFSDFGTIVKKYYNDKSEVIKLINSLHTALSSRNLSDRQTASKTGMSYFRFSNSNKASTYWLRFGDKFPIRFQLRLFNDEINSGNYYLNKFKDVSIESAIIEADKSQIFVLLRNEQQCSSLIAVLSNL